MQKKVVTEAIKKAAADLYLLRGSIYIYDGKMQKAFDDFDACVTLVPSMIEQVKKFQVYHLAASYSNLLNSSCRIISPLKQKDALLL